jgi:oxaloacetate decarboxylase alpha subunit
LQKKVLGDEKPITGRYADTLEPEFEKAKAKLGSTAQSDLDVLSYIAFPVIAEKFFQKREESKAVTVTYSIVKK